MPGARDGVKDVYPDGMDPMVAFREGGSSCHGTSPLVTIPTPEARELPELCVSQQGAYPQCFSSTAAPYRKPDGHRRSATARRTEPRPRAATLAQMTLQNREHRYRFSQFLPFISHPSPAPSNYRTPSTRLANQTPLQPKCSSNLPLSSPLPPLHCPSPS